MDENIKLLMGELVDNLIWTGNDIKRLDCLDAKSSGQFKCEGCQVDWHSDTRAELISKFKVD